MLDVIITISDSTPVEWVDQAVVSVNIAAEDAGFPVQLYMVPGYPGHIGKAMAYGAAYGHAPYIAWVDDDDYVLPNAFSCLLPWLMQGRQGPAMICAREIALFANGVQTRQDRRHHLTAYNRCRTVDVIDLRDYPAMPNAALHKLAGNDVVDVLEWVYVRRMRHSPGSILRNNVTEHERSLL